MTPNEITEALRIDANQLYREEVFTDRRAGSIRRMVPVQADGSPDPTRAVVFVGQAQLLTPMGTLPLAFEIQAGTLEEAIEAFPKAAETALDETLRELEEMRREAASQIVIPEAGGLGGGGGLGGVGGLGGAGGAGGGGIKLP
jgi:hypothetical protein